jgi:hypothetical protein
MEKLRLDPDALTVTSFDVPRELAGAAGTVQAQEFGPTNGNTCRTCPTNCLPYC